jgi:BirA family biotin operon repressor/biotin-[acetyl-CoA-carboxylase] ligase
MDFKIIHIDETDSTNRWLKEHSDSSLVSLSDVAKEPSLCVVADYQTAGKGCGTNSWESERGKNLTFSVMLHPVEIPASGQFRISEAVSVALCTTLEAYIYNKVEIKWPNDIYVGDQKICGILIENRLQGTTIMDSIVGIGLNVNQQTFRSDAPNPVSMYQLVGHEMDRTALLDAFLKALDEAMDSETVGTDYRSRLYRRDGFYDYRDVHGDFQAKLLNVLDDGRLVLLDTEGTARLYAFKEVQYII